MRKIVRRCVGVFELLGLVALASSIVAAAVALRHIIDTPQPLESILPGEAHLYRWRHGHIFYKILGNRDAPPLVLLHTPSLGNSAYEMRKIVGALAQEYRVYALDLLGFGLSDHPSIDYTSETYIAMCHDFLTQVVGQPVTLLASGLSCNYAVHVAYRYPSICSRLILISPSELFEVRQPPKVWTAVLQRPLGRFLLYPLLTTRSALQLNIKQQHAAHQGQLIASDIDYLYATTHQFGAEHAPMARFAGDLNVDASKEFDALQQPTLIIWGARALNNARFISREQHLPARAEIVLIQDADVSVHEEYPALVVGNIRGWNTTGTQSPAGEEEKETSISNVNTPAEVLEPEQETAEASNGAPTPATEPEQEAAGTPQVSPTPDAKAEQSVAREDSDEQLLAYCVKCKMKTVMLDPQPVTMKNGRAAIKGTCSICGSGQFRIGRL
jgi:pimeloyl-ACP methyl ester carboxylesterase